MSGSPSEFPGLRDAARGHLGALEGEAFLARLALVLPDLQEALEPVYGGVAEVPELVRLLVGDALAAAGVRRESLRVLDRRREVDPSWFLDQRMVGYVCYADRFAGSIGGVRKHLGHLAGLGVRYLHLMPLLRPREGENDGGYAVVDYDDVDPRLGTMADLEDLAEDLHDLGIALCADLVLNHTAQEHPWARAAAAGDPDYRDFYFFFPDRSLPDAYERTLPEVFPDMAPGSFTRLDTGEWVWTTFHEFQWDLNWAEPRVFRAMLGALFGLANRGVDVIRLDAVPFLWKRMGTNCQNQPEAHRLLQALRALTRLAMPGVILKAEAIVGPDELVPYLGGHEHYRPECDLAYDNQLMVMLWSALAARDARLATAALRRRAAVPRGAGWVTYLRCHDDIGWAVSDVDAGSVGLDPAAHRAFLARFFAGEHPGSFARGLTFGSNERTGDARTSGMASALAGLAAAEDEQERTAALRRLVTLYSVVYSFGGIPLIYMGDEIALGNDDDWAENPAHSDDNRWAHRPRMDWATVAAATPSDPAGRMLAEIRRLGEVRASTTALRGDAACTVLDVENPRVLAYRRRHPRSPALLALASFSDHPESVDAAVLAAAGVFRPVHLHSSTGEWDLREGRITLPAWGFLWVLDADG